MEIKKSSRHSKIIGDFGEQLTCNLLSRSGFEVSIVDHTGIDILAYNPDSGERLGITEKSRTRLLGSENNKVNVFKKKSNDRVKTIDACRFFSCEPWIAVYVETFEGGELYLTSLKNYDAKYVSTKDRAIDDWKMTPKWRQLYEGDLEVKYVVFKFESVNW